MSEPTHRHPEPEIIPPGQPDRDPSASRWHDRRRGGTARAWVWTNDQRGTRLRYGRPGPLGLFFIFAALATLGALGFFVFLGALAITIPVVVALMLVGLIGGVLRRL
jgi:hypothetical protein